MATTADYLALIPSANASKAKFAAMVDMLLGPIVEIQNAANRLPTLFDIDTAVGDQLDKVGEWVGLPRELPVPIAGVYFSLDVPGLGLDQGVIRGPYDPVSALTRLDDTTYRLIMKIKAAANNWDGSLEKAQAMLASIQSSGTLVFVQDKFDMSYLIGVSGIVPSTLFVSILKQMSEWLRPGGVRLDGVYVTSVSGAPIFGLDVQNSYIAGLDTGAIAVPYA